MRILYVAQWFEPEPAFKGIAFARALTDRGHEVEVATAFPNYPGGKLYPGYRLRAYRREIMDGITIHRNFVWPSHDRSSIGRALNYTSFWLSALLFGLFRGRRYDVVYVYHPPITPALAAAWFCSLWRRPFVVEIQDLWPDSVAASGMAGGQDRWLVRVLDSLCRYAYRQATTIVTQSDGMKARLIARGVPSAKLERIYNYSTYVAARPDACARQPVRDAFAGRVNMVYGGNLGQAQALETVIDALARARCEHPALHLHLFGGGVERDRLVAHTETMGVASSVTFHGPVERAAMDRIFDLADILVLHLKADPLYEITIPSKTQHYLSCGKPIIAGLSGEAADLLHASGAARLSAPEDVGAMADAMATLAEMSAADRATLGKRGRDFYEANLAFAPAIDQTVAVIERAVGHCHYVEPRPGSVRVVEENSKRL